MARGVLCMCVCILHLSSLGLYNTDPPWTGARYNTMLTVGCAGVGG